MTRIIEGQTWAGSKVYEQPVDPLMEVMKAGVADKTPVIAIYTHEAIADDPLGVADQFREHSLTCMIYIYLPPKVTVTEDATSLEIDNHGAGLALDLVARQIFAAMRHGDAEWIAIWRKIALKFEKIKQSFVLHEIENGTNIPVMEIRLEIKTVAEPSYGEPLYGAWLMLDTKLRQGGAEQTQLADILKAMIETPEDLEPLELIQMQFGLTDAGAAASGFGYAP